MKYFSIKELCKSQTAIAKGWDNTPNLTEVSHLNELVDNILDPLREAWGSGIKVNSGFRNERVNKAVGGSSTSAHRLGYAADLAPMNGKMTEFKTFVKKWLKDRNFDQYINDNVMQDSIKMHKVSKENNIYYSKTVDTHIYLKSRQKIDACLLIFLLRSHNPLRI